MRAGIVALASAWAVAAPARAADLELWNEVGASAEVATGLRVGFDQEVRLDDGASRVERIRPAAWTAWRTARWLSLRVGYRYEIEPHFTPGSDYADGWHEGWIDATLRRKVNRLRLSLRLRLEERWGRPWTADGALERSHAARERLELEWPFSRRIALVASGELFQKLTDPDGLRHRWRAGAGVVLRRGAHEITLRYLLDRPLTPGGQIAHVLGLSYHVAR